MFHLIRRNQQLPQVESKTFEIGLNAADIASENVVGQNGRDGHSQAGRRHDEGFTHWPGDLVDGDLPAAAIPTSAW